MALQASQPDNKNFLSPIGFRFSIQKLPHVNYFCTSASLPSVSLAQIDTITNPFIKLPVPGDKLDFGELRLAFRIDEDLKNFQEIYAWMESIGYPDNFDQRTPHQRPNPKQSGETVYSDASLVVTTNQYKPNIEVKFTDLYPVELSSVEFNIEQNDIEYLNAEVAFVYRKYELLTIT
jgi:hypothetical protein